LAARLASDAGSQVRLSRKRRRLSQGALARQVGISRPRLADIEAGRGASVPLEVWLAIAQALGRYLRFEFARDALTEPADAGHLLIQELVIRLAKACGWEVSFEARSGTGESERSIDARLIDRTRRRLVIVECWNTFSDLGAATRSSNRKVQDALQNAVAIAGDGAPFEVGLCWVVRDTQSNRDLVARYRSIFEARLPGSSVAWVKALTEPGALTPSEPGLVWCDTGGTRIFARRTHASSPSTTATRGG
jgi:transcriptional regulator with XRE-family HTH domain